MYEPSQVAAVNGDMEGRLQWDPRFIDGRVLDKKDDGEITFYFKTKKPPVPGISQREMVTRRYNYDYQGNPLTISHSVDHADVPIDDSFFGMVRANMTVNACLIEKNPNGPGTLMTELREIKLNGNMGFAVNSLSKKMPRENFDVWKTVLAEQIGE